MRATSAIRHVGVVIPARDEDTLLGPCLDALADAIGAISQPTSVVIVLDSCTDTSVEVLGNHDRLRLTVVHTNAMSAGASRRVGVATLLTDVTPEISPAQLWIANTDADSTVDRRWLGAQLAHANDGADVVLGLVNVADWSPWPPAIRERYQLGYASALYGTHHRHVHGANLGIRADRYQRVGGFAELATGEDVDLVQRCEAAGAPMTWALDVLVTTSSRPDGRAPEGFARHLSSLSALPDDIV